MNIAIIDDSLNERQILSDFVNEYFNLHPLFKTISLFSDGTQFISQWRPGAFDLIFLDIYMDGMDGISVVKTIREQNDSCLIVFTTNSTEHAIIGYELRVFDYLLKPVHYEKLEKTLNLCIRSLRQHNHYIEVKESRINVKILLDDILFTDYYNHYIQIHTVERVIRSYMRFDVFSPLLLCYPQFLCCYRNCIVNMDHIFDLEKNDFILDTKERVPIIRTNRQAIHQQYADYQFQKLNSTI